MKTFIMSSILSTLLFSQNMPVTLVGQYSFNLTNTFSHPAAKLECKKTATMVGIKAHLVIMYPEPLSIDDETINCIYDNLLTVEVV